MIMLDRVNIFVSAEKVVQMADGICRSGCDRDFVNIFKTV